MITRLHSGRRSGVWLSSKSKMFVLSTDTQYALNPVALYEQYYNVRLSEFLEENASSILAVIDDDDWALDVWKRLLQRVGSSLPQHKYDEYVNLLAVYDDDEDRFEDSFRTCLLDLVLLNASAVAAWLLEDIKVENLVAYTDYVTLQGTSFPGLLFKATTNK